MKEWRLVVDIGNEKMAASLVRGRDMDHLSKIDRFPTHSGTAEDMIQWVKESVRGEQRQLDDLRSIDVASVVPKRNDDWIKVSAGLKIPVRFFSHEMVPQFLASDIENPSKVGPDRLVNGWVAYQLLKKPCIVLDCGTATTVDVVDAKGVFQGGFIVPGLGKSLENLTQTTALLPSVALQPLPFSIGKNTASAIGLGTLWGTIFMLRGFVRRLDPKQEMHVFLTGGWSHVLRPGLVKLKSLRSRLTHDPALTLKGLVCVFS